MITVCEGRFHSNLCVKRIISVNRKKLTQKKRSNTVCTKANIAKAFWTIALIDGLTIIKNMNDNSNIITMILILFSFMTAPPFYSLPTNYMSFNTFK
jgi:hypothetical protein